MDVQIAGRPIGRGQPVYIVAELSGNHNGDIERAVSIIREAAAAGADAVKLQTYTADTITMDCDRPEFVVGGEGPWAGRTLHDLYQEAHTPWEWHARLFAEARAAGITIFSTPFDATAVDFLETLQAPAYKIASFEIVDDALLRTVARTGKPVVVSTGMATLEETAHAVATLRAAGCAEVILLRCTSSYPAPDASLMLATIPRMAAAFDCPVGLSDHSLGTTAPVVAVALGACLVEKHLTLRRADGGVDSHFSLEPDELRALVREVRRAEAMIGEAAFGPGVAEEGNIAFRRSLYVVEDVAEGGRFTERNVRSIRPGYGLSPRYMDVVLGKKATRRVTRGTPLSWSLLCDE
jgi:pseudaminic acid synthase